VKVTPAVSWMRTEVYQPCGVEALHPVLLNGTGFSPKVTTNEAEASGVGVAGGDV
jgi:hypothetical protein